MTHLLISVLLLVAAEFSLLLLQMEVGDWLGTWCCPTMAILF